MDTHRTPGRHQAPNRLLALLCAGSLPLLAFGQGNMGQMPPGPPLSRSMADIHYVAAVEIVDGVRVAGDASSAVLRGDITGAAAKKLQLRSSADHVNGIVVWRASRRT